MTHNRLCRTNPVAHSNSYTATTDSAEIASAMPHTGAKANPSAAMGSQITAVKIRFAIKFLHICDGGADIPAALHPDLLF